MPFGLRRLVLLALAAGLSVAALIAIIALLTHTFDQTDAQLIGTSLGFSVFSALAASGEPARGKRRLALLGMFTTGAAGLSFVLFLVAIWVWQEEACWRLFGALAVIALVGSHASLVLSARRSTDPPLVTRLVSVSVLAAGVDAVMAVLPIAGLVDHVDSGEVRFAAVLVVAMLLTTALPPILRRAGSASGSLGQGRRRDQELRGIADRLDGLAPKAGHLAGELQREASRLRELSGGP
ncbi:MAG: hypothetical protein J2O48_05590 [Solirubrobacterales bacterium]|nr:hypothetical protein [Solirubrobacterales bacterium]